MFFGKFKLLVSRVGLEPASFYNLETEKVLKKYLAKKKPSRSLRLFLMASKEAHNLRRSARKKRACR